MKKQALLKSFVILLPILAVGLASTRDSVLVFDTQAGTTAYYSYFDLLPVAEYQLITPLAGLLCIVSGILAAVYLIGQKKGCLMASAVASFAASALGILPVIHSGDVRVFPNVGVPIMMFADYVLAYYVAKNEAKLAQKNKAPRLRK